MTFAGAAGSHRERPGLLEVWIDHRFLLAFDGRILELFTNGETTRIHIAYAPRLEFRGTQKLPRLIIRARFHNISMSYDPAQRPGLEMLDAALASAAR